MATIRDRLWTWGQSPGTHHGVKNVYRLPHESRMTALESACIFDVPNCCRVVMGELPVPPFDQEAMVFDSLDRVVWFISGSGGSTRNDSGGRTARRSPASPDSTQMSSGHHGRLHDRKAHEDVSAGGTTGIPYASERSRGPRYGALECSLYTWDPPSGRGAPGRMRRNDHVNVVRQGSTAPVDELRPACETARAG